jgi:hypothetical protein
MGSVELTCWLPLMVALSSYAVSLTLTALVAGGAMVQGTHCQNFNTLLLLLLLLLLLQVDP